MTTPTIRVADIDLPFIEYQGQPVVTYAMIDAAHKRQAGTARKRFADNKRHLIEGEDFYIVDSKRLSEIRTTYSDIFPERTTRLTLFSETGYLMLVKSLTDDLAWQVQRQLVKSYFRTKPSQQVANQPTAEPPIPAPITSEQRHELFTTANDIFRSFGGFQQSATGWYYNRLRTHYHLKRTEDLRQDDYADAMALLEAQKPKVKHYNAIAEKMRESFFRDVIGDGECWTAWLSRQAGGAHCISDTPDWKQIARDIYAHNGLLPHA